MPARSAREVAYETIRSRIITMELKPGDELNDRELAQELGISRTPMREALIMLNIAHMVTIKPQSGTHVAPIDLKLMEMEQFARYTLEKEMLNRIRGKVPPEQEAVYRQLIEDTASWSTSPRPSAGRRGCWTWTMPSTAEPSSSAAWRSTLTTCSPPSSTLSGCGSSASRPRRTNPSVLPMPASWKPSSTARRRMSAAPFPTI